MAMHKKLEDTMSLDEFIEWFEHHHKHSIDASPYGIQRTTERRMLLQLNKLAERIENGNE